MSVWRRRDYLVYFEKKTYFSIFKVIIVEYFIHDQICNSNCEDKIRCQTFYVMVLDAEYLLQIVLKSVGTLLGKSNLAVKLVQHFNSVFNVGNS